LNSASKLFHHRKFFRHISHFTDGNFPIQSTGSTKQVIASGIPHDLFCYQNDAGGACTATKKSEFNQRLRGAHPLKLLAIRAGF